MDLNIKKWPQQEAEEWFTKIESGNGKGEGYNIDWKMKWCFGPTGFSPEETNNTTQRAVSGFANTYGGILVFGFDKQIQKFLPILEEKITHFILSIPIIIAGIFITLVITFFILKDWENILKKIVDFLPMRKKTIKRLIREFGNITHTVIYAQLFVALVQGIIATVGFYILGVPFPLILGVVTAFCALIPAIGTGIIWLPASLYLTFMGYFSQDYWILSKGIILFFYGLFIISTIDNILLAKLF